MNRRKLAKWLIVAAILAAVGFASWFVLSLFFGKSESAPGDSWVPSIFFPISSPGNPSNGDDRPVSPIERLQVPKLRQLSDVPTAGMVAFTQPEKSSLLKAGATIFRWIERGTGHVYESKSNDTTKTRISNTTIPGIQEAFFSRDGEYVVGRYLRPNNETIETFVGSIESVTETSDAGYVFNETKLVTRFLEPNILAAGDSPKDGYFYKVNPLGQGSSVSLAAYATSSSIKLFDSPLSQWIVSWASTTLTLQNKADSNKPGYLFSVDEGTGKTEKVIGRRNGLTTLVNPEGTRALFSETTQNDLRLWVKNLESGEERLLELRTLPEKCAWSPTEEDTVYCGAPDFYARGPYPTNWYQGRFSFDDNVWKINSGTEDYTLLHDSRTSDETFDVWKPSVSPDGDYLLFLNKNDLTLWSLETAA